MAENKDMLERVHLTSERNAVTTDMLKAMPTMSSGRSSSTDRGARSAENFRKSLRLDTMDKERSAYQRKRPSKELAKRGTMIDVKLKTLSTVLSSNQVWASRQTDEFLDKQDAGQNPKILWLGCSDSRVPPTEITRLKPGDIFVHRNIGNGFYDNDANCGAVIEYAVKALGVWHVVVCGHCKLDEF